MIEWSMWGSNPHTVHFYPIGRGPWEGDGKDSTLGAESPSLREESYIRRNQEVFREDLWKLTNPGVKGTAGPWNTLVPWASVSRPGTQLVWPNPQEVYEAFRDTVILENGSRVSAHRWLLIEWLGGVRLFLGSSNLRDLETPRGVEE